MIQAGKYKGKATSVEFAEKTFQGETKVTIVVALDAWMEYSDASEPIELVWTGSFSEKAKDITIAQLKQLGFAGAAHEVTGVTLADLKNEVDISVKYTEWQGEQQMRVSIVTPYVGKPASKSALSTLAASLGGPAPAKRGAFADDAADKDVPFS